MRRIAILFLTFSALLFSTIGAATADDTIYAGIDVWRTPGGGSSFYDFAADPLPAGFFCQRSQPFAGRIVLRGAPLVTGKAGALGGADTIIHRLDDARFVEGAASSRVQVRALSLESVVPVKTACGSYQVKASLAGVQPVTRMRLSRESEAGGRFLAPLAMNVKLTFTPLNARSGRSLEVVRPVRFPANPQLRWSSDLVGRSQHVGAVKVDTDGDRVADTHLPGTSNFVVAMAPPDKTQKAVCATYITIDGLVCHCDASDKEHCTEPTPIKWPQP